MIRSESSVRSFVWSRLRWCGGGCGGSPSASANRQQNVMVIDEGIDLAGERSAGQGRRRATRRPAPSTTHRTRAGAPMAVRSMSAPSFDTLKQMYLAALAQPDDSCHLTAGISAKADPLASVAQFKCRWNAMVRANKTLDGRSSATSEYLQFMGPINTEFKIASAITAPPPPAPSRTRTANVRLVLVERAARVGGVAADQLPLHRAGGHRPDGRVAERSADIYAAAVNQPATIDSELGDADGEVRRRHRERELRRERAADARDAADAVLPDAHQPLGVLLAASTR